MLKVVNPPDSLIVLQDDYSTDLYDLQTNTVKFSFQKVFRSVCFHDTRLVCDYQAYDLSSFELVGSFKEDFKDLTTTCAVSFNEWLIYGHEKCGMVTLYSWNRALKRYDLVLKKYTLWKGDVHLGPMCVNQMQVAYKDDLHCILYAVCQRKFMVKVSLYPRNIEKL
jgi:hypothetical protein